MPQHERKWYSINKQLLPVKGIYFFFLGAIGALLPYITIYMKQLGLSSTETGIIYGLMPFISFLVRPLFGVLADKTKKHKLVLILCTLLTGVFYCLLMLTPRKEMDMVRVMTNVQSSPIDSFILDCWSADGKTDNKCEQSLTDYERQSFNSKSNSLMCEFQCVLAVGLAETFDVCFTDDIGKYSGDGCDVKLNQSQGSLAFSADIVSVIQSEIEGANSTYNGLTCKNYDLKNIMFNGGKYWQLLSDAEVSYACNIQCPGQYAHTICDEHNFGKTFWVFFVIFLFCNIFFSPVFGIVDAIAYDMLGAKAGYWGLQRLWGTIGFSLFAIGSSIVMYFASTDSMNTDYTPSFLIFLGLSILASVVTFMLKFSESIHCPKMLSNFLPLLKNFKIVVFLIVITFFGIFNSVTEAFLFWYLQTLGAVPIVFGLCLVASCLGEIFILMLSGWIIKKIGRVMCLQLGLFAYVVRFLYHSLIVNPWTVLPAELLHCLCFGLMYAGASSYANLIAPEGMSATIQGLLGGLYFGFGKGIGSLVTGKLVDPDTGLGFMWTFRFYSILAAGILVLYSLLYFFCFRDQADLTDNPSDKGQNGMADGDETAAGETLLSDNTVSNENAVV